MEFKDNEAIYLQIAAYVSENILLEKWVEEEKIPSVRDLAINLQVNPNTVMRTYEYLQNKEVIYNKRGLGFFVSLQGKKKIKVYLKEQFLQQELPALFKNMYLLNIDFSEMQVKYDKFLKDNYSSKTETNENK